MSNFMSSSNNLVVIDAMNLSFRWKHERFKLPEAMNNGLLESFVEGQIGEDEVRSIIKDYFMEEGAYFGEEFRDTVLSIAASYNAPRVIIAADSGKSLFRRQIYPEYKANRVAKLEQNSITDTAVFSVFFEMYTEALQNELKEAGDVVHFHFVEADDIAAYIVNHTKAREKYDHIWLVTSDKDWDLLLRDNVSRFNWMTQKSWKNIDKTGPRPREITLENWFEHYLYPPEQHLFAKCLEGDDGDNVPGVTGIGPKRAKDLMDKYGTLDNLLANMPLKGTAQYIKNLNEFKPMFEMTTKLMDLNTYCWDAVLNTANQQAIEKLFHD